MKVIFKRYANVLKGWSQPWTYGWEMRALKWPKNSCKIGFSLREGLIMSFWQLFRHSIFSQCLWYSQNDHSICRSSHSACRKSDLSIYEWNYCETETWDRRIPIHACKVEDKVIAMNRMMNRSATDQAVELFSNTVSELVGRPANLLWPFLMDLSFGSRLSRYCSIRLDFP